MPKEGGLARVKGLWGFLKWFQEVSPSLWIIGIKKGRPSAKVSSVSVLWRK
jgi:hypothetical protein